MKYAVLFLSLAFMAVFVLELVAGRPMHPVQYLFAGLAMVFFYVLLLSLAEHIGFGPAYLVAAAACGGMLATYVGMALQSRMRGLAMLAVFERPLRPALPDPEASRTTPCSPAPSWASPR